MNHRVLLVAVSLSLSLVAVAGCKKDPREVIHTEEIGNTGWVIDLPKDTRTSKEEDYWRIKNGSYLEGSIFRTKIDEDDRIPDESWAASMCAGSNPDFKDTANGGKSITCFTTQSGTKYMVAKSWIPDGEGNFFGCDYKAFAENEKDASALKLARRVCASIRKK
jgi:hypothetical protein